MQAIKKILVTGGAGFIGSHLCERLSKNPNYKVYSLDNYFTGQVTNHVENVSYIRGDTQNIQQLIDFHPDLIFHLGEYARVEQSFHDIQTVWEYNSRGTFAVLEFARVTQAKLIYAGSSTKFGDNGLGRSQSPYAWFKACNTELVKNYGNWFNLQFAITYFYNVYGEREIAQGKYATLIALFKDAFERGLPLKVVSPGTQKRNFTHIDDIINGLIIVGESGYGDEFGIGSPEAFSVYEIANMFGGEIIMLPERHGNRMTAEVVSAKTQALGWKPGKSIADYIAKIKKNKA